ncbi:unnamed protein product [Closterium sp. NIES-64]|nr:unnamed protein product [Closterium sp. NIES-64]
MKDAVRYVIKLSLYPSSPSPMHLRSGMDAGRGAAQMQMQMQDEERHYELAVQMQDEERHYELAVQMQDEVEQQRSSTQLGRAYFDSFTSRADAAAAAGTDIEASLEQQAASMQTLKSARKYFQLSLRLAKGLHEGGEGIGGAGARAGGNGRVRGARAGRSGGGSGGRSWGGDRRFAQELADAYNNVGLLFEEVESYDEAVNCFDRGLEVGVGRRLGLWNALPLPSPFRLSQTPGPFPLRPRFPSHFLSSPFYPSDFASPSMCARAGGRDSHEFKVCDDEEIGSIDETRTRLHNIVGRVCDDEEIGSIDETRTRLHNSLGRVCDDEEIGSIDETRTRLHNSLGRVYTKSCKWEQARKHIDMDVRICERLNNAVGCAKAWINKGDFCFKKEEYDEAERAFRRARDILQQVEDEAALLATCESNLENVGEAKRQKEHCEQLWGQHRKTQRLLERAG